MTSSPERKTPHVTTDESDNLDLCEEKYYSLDPLDVRRVSFDLFEVYCHEMIHTKSFARRPFLTEKMRYMTKRLVNEQYDYGRLWNYTTAASSIAMICSRDAYRTNLSSNEDDDKYSETFKDCLVDFKLERWKRVLTKFDALRDKMIRKDASMIFLPTEIAGVEGSTNVAEDEGKELIPEENDTLNQVVESMALFREKYDIMAGKIKIHACLSCLRPEFEEIIQALSSEETEPPSVHIPHEKIVAFENEISILFGDDEESAHADILKSLLNDDTEQDPNCKKRNLKSFQEIEGTYQAYSECFDLIKFQRSFLRLIRRWVNTVLPVPRLAELGYGTTAAPIRQAKDKVAAPAYASSSSVPRSPSLNVARRRPIHDTRHVGTSDTQRDDGDDDEILPEKDGDSATTKAVENLAHKRNSFMKKVSDPKEESLAIAEQAQSRKDGAYEKETKQSMRTFLQKKSLAYQIAWEDSDEAENEAENVTISDVPKRYQNIKREDEKTISSPRKKRKFFTETEDKAILDGVDEFGVGKWSDIKSKYSVQLKDRNNVQIKDRHRTLSKSKEEPLL